MLRPRLYLLLTLSMFATAAVYAVPADQPPAPQGSKNTAPSTSKEPAGKPSTGDPSGGKTSVATPGGVVVFIDPATGQIRQPDASEIGGLVTPAGPAPKAPEPALLQGPGGAVGARLGADSLTYMVVTAAPDGKLAMDCVTGEKAAAVRVTSPGTTAASQAKEMSQGPAHAQDTGATRQAETPAPQKQDTGATRQAETPAPQGTHDVKVPR